MANSIALSSDMNTIYIIDANDDVIFSQSLSGHGAIISLDSDSKLSGQAASSTSSGTTTTKSVDGWQWTAAYNPPLKKLYFIGTDDMDTAITDAISYSIDRTNGVQVKRSGDDLILIAVTV